MMLEIEKLQRRKPFATAATTISATTAVITILSITVLMTTYITFISLPQSSFAQTATTTNANQPKGVITPCTLTESGGQGPEYKPGPPFRQGQDFAKSIPGQRLIVTGKVLNLMNCKSVQGAVLDIWQTNSTGDYDYKGFNLRGKVVTDKDGNYVLNTVYPVRLQGPNEMTRPSHIHVIVGVPGQPLITTQVYFENQPKDSLLKNSLIALPVTAANGTKMAHFNFVVEDYRGFDISKGIEGNPTIGVISGQGAINK